VNSFKVTDELFCYGCCIVSDNKLPLLLVVEKIDFSTFPVISIITILVRISICHFYKYNKD
jgi:hypothetical protein